MNPIVPVSMKNVRTMRAGKKGGVRKIFPVALTKDRPLTSITEIQHRRNKFTDFELDEEVEDAVEENVHCTSARDDKRPPVPSIILAAQLEIRHHDG